MNDTKKYKKTHLVIADDESDAEFKLKRHYRNMCSSYSISYSVNILDLEEAIV